MPFEPKALFKLLAKHNDKESFHLTDLVKDVVSEQLEHVAVAVLWPAEVAVQLGAIDDRAQLCQDAEQSEISYCV